MLGQEHVTHYSPTRHSTSRGLHFPEEVITLIYNASGPDGVVLGVKDRCPQSGSMPPPAWAAMSAGNRRHAVPTAHCVQAAWVGSMSALA